ncbi:DUF523 domain-containing protein [Desulfosporosinus sp. FKB]|uniref:DUF523 domain-containing protein n=1 Tax=Desulfosporosinus sp. FKB TaxID=1969835 RepID=UPI000B4A117A|nr:DUF523 domain-containing protein [Desulfosporosinus sp. FKB]
MLLVSACLAGINCRYDGKNTKIEEIEKLVKDGKAIPICPEVIAGLNIPRDSCEILVTDDGEKKVISRDNEDFTEAYKRGAEQTLTIAKIIGINTAILKARSPSCGFGQVYDGTFSRTLLNGNGFTAKLLLDNGIRVYTEEDFKNVISSELNLES